MITRGRAIELWREHNTEDSLYKHALAVEAIMRHYARLHKEDEEQWGILGLLHDIDYQKYPEEHCTKAREILEKENVSEEIIRAMESHGYGICTDVEPISVMEKTLYTIDELSGLIMACALVRPSKSLDDLELKSVKKKWKDLRFAAGVDRKIVQNGADMLNQDIDSLIQECLISLRSIGENLGLQRL